jgi:hypothetical protein
MNKEYADRLGLDEETQAAIQVVGNRLVSITKRPKMFSDDPKKILEMIHVMEGTLQMLWGFDYNTDHHYFSFSLEDCKCPQADNFERIGTPMRVYNLDCPFHGDGDWE